MHPSFIQQETSYLKKHLSFKECVICIIGLTWIVPEGSGVAVIALCSAGFAFVYDPPDTFSSLAQFTQVWFGVCTRCTALTEVLCCKRKKKDRNEHVKFQNAVKLLNGRTHWNRTLWCPCGGAPWECSSLLYVPNRYDTTSCLSVFPRSHQRPCARRPQRNRMMYLLKGADRTASHSEPCTLHLQSITGASGHNVILSPGFVWCSISVNVKISALYWCSCLHKTQNKDVEDMNVNVSPTESRTALCCWAEKQNWIISYTFY